MSHPQSESHFSPFILQKAIELRPTLTPFEPSTDHRQTDRRLSPALILSQLPETWWNDLRELLELETGMELSGSRSARLREAVTNVIRKHRLAPSLLHDRAAHGRFVEHVAAELTVGESFFLRNEHHMQVLRETILPQIQQENQSRREIRIWSAGCACGEEPYSLAILLDELQSFQPWKVSILGTDLNPAFLEKARAAKYRAWSFRQSNIHQDSRYFSPIPEGYQVRDHLREHVRFHYLNLVKDIYPSGLNGTLGLDLILFRNVAIYLKSEVTAAILRKMFQALRPGGWLLLGEIEVALTPEIGFEVHRFANVTIHRKPLRASPVSAWVPSISKPIPSPSASRIFSLPARTPVALPPAPLPSAKASIVPETNSPRVNHPAGQAARLQQARTFLQLAQTDQAREQLKLSLAEDPLCIEAYLLLGGLEEDAGELQRAEQSYRRALYLDRDCALIHFHLGLVLQQQGENQRGIQSLKTALLLATRHPPEELVRHGDGVCYGRLQEMVLMLTGDSDD